MKTTKIDWCDSTLNPVIGCGHNCPYCYARRLNDRRFPWSIPDFTKPQFFPDRLLQLKSKTPKSIFMDSMSDIAFWSKDALVETIKAIFNNPQHRYVFLTKATTPNYIPQMELDGVQLIFRGYSVDTQARMDVCAGNFDFLSIEPILEPIRLPFNIGSIKAIIIGAETGNRKNKVVPRKEWLTSLVAQADTRGIAVYMKDSKQKILQTIMGDDFRQDPLPWQMREVR